MSGNAWMEGFDARVTAASSLDEVRSLWREQAQKYEAGALTDEDQALIKAALTVRKSELEPAA